MTTEKPEILTLGELESYEFKPDFYREMSWDAYFLFAQKHPSVSYSSYQRMYQAIMSEGFERYSFARRDHIHYKFFDDLDGNGADAIFGLDRRLMRLVEVNRAAAARLGQERRLLLFHGPVGSSKSTLARRMRTGFQEFTKTEDGQLYTFSWFARDDEDKEILGVTTSTAKELKCPVHEDPLMLLPRDLRPKLASVMNSVQVVDRVSGQVRNRLPEERIVFEPESGLCPLCRFVYEALLVKYKGNWKKMLQEHILVRRLIFSEIDRVGIGSFRPKDEKNQDSTELSGDINYRKIAEYGAESDPRAFNFDGEFQVSHRGIFHVDEIFKLDKAFLYDFLFATQEHKIKPKRFAEMFVDCFYIAGTNNPEYEKLREDDTMEAFRDRTTRIDIPYVLKLFDEEQIYKKVYRDVPGQKHIAPHTIEMASLWALLTRVKKPNKPNVHGISLRNKVRLYNGKAIANYTEEHVHDLMFEFPEEGMSGISPRYIQDKIGDAMSEDIEVPCVTWFAVKKELHEGMDTHSLLKKSDRITEYRNLLSEVEEEFTELLKGEVQEAIAADEKDVVALFTKYINNVVAHVNGEKIRDHRGEFVEPDEKLMREVEEKQGVRAQEKEEHRRKLVQSMGTLSMRGKKFDFKSDEELYKALKLKLFDDRKDTISLSTLHTRVIDEEEQKKIEIVKGRMKEKFGYCDFCATLAMSHVASIFASGNKPAK